MRYYATNHGTRGVSVGIFGLIFYGIGWLVLWAVLLLVYLWVLGIVAVLTVVGLVLASVVLGVDRLQLLVRPKLRAHRAAEGSFRPIHGVARAAWATIKAVTPGKKHRQHRDLTVPRNSPAMAVSGTQSQWSDRR